MLSKTKSNKLFVFLLLLSISFVVFVAFAENDILVNDHVFITEICTNNNKVAYDDNGKYDGDYIELYNDSEDEINLNNYYLSDEKKNLKKFPLENIIIKPHETVVVWNNTINDDPSLLKNNYYSKDIHGLNFSISDGETIYLTYMNGLIVDVVSLPEIIENGKVYSCCIDEERHFKISKASLYKVLNNWEEEKDAIKSLESPVFSIKGGWYQEPISLSLESQEGTIYYTLDGSEPSINSNIYTGPIKIENRTSEENIYANIKGISNTNDYVPDYRIDKGTTVKAIAVNNNEISNVASQTYFIGLDDPSYNNISIMEITVNPDDFFGYEDGIYVSGKVYDMFKEKYDEENYSLVDNRYRIYRTNFFQEGIGWEREAKIEFFNSYHERLFEQNIGIRIHGGWSRTLNQKSFNLYAREEYDGNSTFKYDFFGKSYNKVILRNGGFKDTYALKLRDVFNQSLVKDRNVGIQNYEPCIVFINGEYWGLYNLQESLDIKYVSENYDVKEDNIALIKSGEAKPNSEYIELYNQLVDYVMLNDITDYAVYDNLTTMMDIQSYLDYYIFEMYVSNSDSLFNNYCLWRSINYGEGTYEDCKWRWLIYDTDDSTSIATETNHYDSDPFYCGHWQIAPLAEDGNGDEFFQRLLTNETFRCQFIRTYLDMVNSCFSYEKTHKALIEVSNLYKQATINSQKRFRGGASISLYDEDIYVDEYTNEVYENDLKIYDDFFKNRKEYFILYLNKYLWIEDYRNIEIICDVSNKCKISLNTIEDIDIDSNWVGEYNIGSQNTISCQPVEGYKFVGYEDQNGIIISTDNNYSFYLYDDVYLKVILEKE